MPEDHARVPVPPQPGLIKSLQIGYGRWRQQLARKSSSERDKQVDGLGGDLAYCGRLRDVYNEMRAASGATPPRDSILLSHVPEWAQTLQQPDDISGEGFTLEMIRAVPRLQAALANCTSYTPSKWLLEQELAQRVSNRSVADRDAEASPNRPFTVEEYSRLTSNSKAVAERGVDREGSADGPTPRDWLLAQQLDRQPGEVILERDLDPDILRVNYTLAIGQQIPWTDAQWIFEHRLAVRAADRLRSERVPADTATKEAVMARYARWAGGEPSWSLHNPPLHNPPLHNPPLHNPPLHNPPLHNPSLHNSSSLHGSSARDVYDAAADERLSGLCLSGGGIRSATFSLGILQVLARHDRLRKFDYISSVSGGGYIHQWLAAWIHREPRGLASVERKLLPLPSTGSLARAPEQINWLRRYSSYLTPRRGLLTADSWTAVATWFRNTSLNQIVLLSFFAVALVLVRALLHPFTMPGVPDGRGPLALTALIDQMWQWVFGFATLVCLAWSGWGLAAFARALRSQTMTPQEGGQPPRGAIGDAEVISLLVVPGFLLSILASLSVCGIFRVHTLAPHLLNGLQAAYTRYLGGFHLLLLLWTAYVAGLLIAVTFGGRALETSRHQRRVSHLLPRRLGFLAAILLSTLLPVGGAVLGTVHGYRNASIQTGAVYAAHRLDDLFNHTPKFASAASDPKAPKATCQVPVSTSSYKHKVPPRALLALLLPLFFFAGQFLAIRLNVGLIGRAYEESRREWLARYGAWSAIASFLWLGLGAITLIGPYIYYWFFDFTLTRKLVSTAAVALLHAVTVYAGSSSKTSGTPDPRKFFGYSTFDLVGIVGAPLAILSLLIVTAGWIDIVTDSSFHHVYDHFSSALNESLSSGNWHLAFLHYVLAVSGPGLAFLVYLAVLLLFGWRVDVNEFSLHPFYRDRLARCYNGASNGQRVPDPFTGFDDHTEVSYSSIALAELLPARFGGQPKDNGTRPAYDGPMPIFCSTVNLTFGQDLAFQDRKGTSFAFTPLYSGYHISTTAETESGFTTTYNGFVPTEDFAYRTQAIGMMDARASGIPLTTAAAISGAALSPNQGFSSQPTLAFLMTLFNTRLGWWIANPRKPWIWPNDLDQPTPRFGLRYLLSELFGYSNDTTNYVSLCDGGRFDNMGLYELVRRRCASIVICDGEQDDNSTFEGLGLAVAKARIDFGVEIEFVPGQLEALAPDPKTGRSTRHFARGTIRYPAPPTGDPDDPKYTGEILYLKTSFVGDEPVDLLHYKREHPDFPQETTLNQWFTEPQFESYRRLGELTAELALGNTP